MLDFLRSPAKTVRYFFNKADTDLGIRFMVLGGVVGYLAGLLALGFQYAIGFITRTLYLNEQGSEAEIWSQIASHQAWYIMLVMAVVGVFVAVFTKRLASEAEGHGVPEVMYAVAAKQGHIRPRVAIVKLVGSALSIGSGFSVGREGPTALIGAALGSSVGQLLKLSRRRMKLMVGCGTAAALAATFNAPLAGMAFALELIVGKFSLNYFGPIVLSSVMGAIVARSIEGNNHELLADVSFGVTSPTEFILIAMLGVFTGLVGVLFSKGLYAFEDLMERLALSPWIKALIGGLAMGGIVIGMPMVAGPAGWDAIRSLMITPPSMDLATFALVLGLVKLLATILSLGTGASGGLFAPSLLIGSSFGLAYGIGVSELIAPSQELQSPVSYALVGMGAFVAAITQAPLTAITVVFELTNRYEIILPLIIALACSVGVYNHLVNGSIYTLKLMRRGINLQWGRDTGVLQSLKVKDILETEDHALSDLASFESILKTFQASSRTSLPVINSAKKLVGIVGLYDLEALKGNVTTKDNKQKAYYNPDVAYIRLGDSLYEAFSKISSGDYSYLPVVRDDGMELVGGLYRHKLLQAYRSALEFRGVIDKAEAASNS